MERHVCVICGSRFNGYGHNPEGAVWLNEKGEKVFPEFKETDRCCDGCNTTYVIPGRIYRLQHRHELEGQ